MAPGLLHPFLLFDVGDFDALVLEVIEHLADANMRVAQKIILQGDEILGIISLLQFLFEGKFVGVEPLPLGDLIIPCLGILNSQLSANSSSTSHTRLYAEMNALEVIIAVATPNLDPSRKSLWLVFVAA